MKNKITITDNASKQILYLRSKENNPDSYFRIKVDGGGCAGFQYNFSFTGKKNSEDLMFSQKNINIVIDDISLDLLEGSTLDYVNELIGSSFKINNPRATSSCGCGTSFSI